jgi:UDP-2,3-diacylglucosamine pyrophosphatase LpxH
MLEDDLKATQQVHELRAALSRALRELDKLRTQRAELVEAVYRAFKDAVSAITIPPVPKPSHDRRRSGEEIALITFSDLQLGQITKTYGTDVARERVDRYATKIERIVKMQRTAHPVRRARLYLLGDIVEGEWVFPTQAWQVDSSAHVQVTITGPEIVTGFIRRMAALFEQVHVVAVPGNHGRVGKANSPETNYDRMLYEICRHLTAQEKRVTWQIAHERGMYAGLAVDTIGPELAVLLWHGDQARRVSSSSHLPFYKLIQGWRSGAIDVPFNISICGHHHTPTSLTIQDVAFYINGTFASDAEYAIERLGSNVRPKQWLLFAKPERGITAEYKIDVERD